MSLTIQQQGPQRGQRTHFWMTGTTLSGELEFLQPKTWTEGREKENVLLRGEEEEGGREAPFSGRKILCK